MNSKIIILFILLAIISGCCNETNSNIANDSCENLSGKDTCNIPHDNCDFVFQGKYSDWTAAFNVYFPLTSLDTALNKQREKYVNRYLVKRNNWLILAEMFEPHWVLNEYPLIPLLITAAEDKKLKKNLTNIFPYPELFCCEVRSEYSKKGEDKYQVIIYVDCPKQCRAQQSTKKSCKHIIDISYWEGIYNFESDCDCDRIW